MLCIVLFFYFHYFYIPLFYSSVLYYFCLCAAATSDFPRWGSIKVNLILYYQIMLLSLRLLHTQKKKNSLVLYSAWQWMTYRYYSWILIRGRTALLPDALVLGDSIILLPNSKSAFPCMKNPQTLHIGSGICLTS